MNMFNKTDKKKRGFVLLITLLLVAVAGTSLAVLTRKSLREALSAKSAVASLQRRWGAISCEASLLPIVEAALTDAQEKNNAVQPILRYSLTLGGQPFELTLADEQAKVNVNTLVSHRGKRVAQDEIKALVRRQGSRVKVKLNPHNTSLGSEVPGVPAMPLFGSFAQVFPNMSPDELIDSGEALYSPVDQVTCWGDGRINFRRASSQAMAVVCSGVLAPQDIDQLISIRTQSPQIELTEAMSQLSLTEKKLEKAQALLADGSLCHSLWVSVRTGDRWRHKLTIFESDANGTGRVYNMMW